MANGFLKTLSEMRAVEWGKSFSWDVRFLTAPAPFTGWFPATDCDRTISQLQTHTFTGFGDSFDIPLGSGSRVFTATFADNDQGVLHDWLTSWGEEEILGNPAEFANIGSQGTRRLANAVKECELARLDARGQFQRIWSLSVFPIGPFSCVRDSNSTFQTYNVSFHIAGVTSVRAS